METIAAINIYILDKFNVKMF